MDDRIWIIETRTEGSTGLWNIYDCNGFRDENVAREKAFELEDNDQDNIYRACEYTRNVSK